MAIMQTVKLSGIWKFHLAVQGTCPAIWTLTSMEETQNAYDAGDTWKARLTALYRAAEQRSMDSCEITCSNWSYGGGEDYSFSNDGELDAIANELRAVLGHTCF